MRKNYPVYDVETALRPDQYLISRTDLKGRITYANPAFIEISGFTRDEL
ncbi:MAG TPA: PAS domain-containing protein, partial [Burkholderiaceae bacterium]|nr:PAS domain-containing protein [Burkholderiaceae bacterium]